MSALNQLCLLAAFVVRNALFCPNTQSVPLFRAIRFAICVRSWCQLASKLDRPQLKSAGNFLLRHIHSASLRLSRLSIERPNRGPPCFTYLAISLSCSLPSLFESNICSKVSVYSISLSSSTESRLASRSKSFKKFYSKEAGIIISKLVATWTAN